MATLELEGIGKVEVDDSFRSLPPEQQEITVNEIVSKLGQWRGPAQPQQPAQPQSGAAKILTDYQNQGMGPGQGTSPYPDQYGAPLGTELHESDTGDILFRNQAGALVPTDQSQHVVLRDPADGQLKVFARSPQTNEGPTTGVGRLFARGFIAGAPTARAAQGVATALRPGQEVVEAAGRLSQSGAPVQVPRAVASDNMMVQQAGAVASNAPFAGTPLVQSAERTIGQLGTKADEVASGFGGGAAATTVSAGEAAKDGLLGWIGGKSAAQANELYRRVDDLVDPNVMTPLDNTVEAVKDVMTRRIGAGISQDSQAVNTVMEAIQRPGGLDYQGIKDLRTYVGEMMNSGILPPGVSQGELKAIYKGLSADLSAAVSNAGGPQAQQAWERANRYYQLASKRRESLAKIVGAKGDAPAEQVMDRMVALASTSSRADISKLSQARKAIGAEGWDEFASGVISRLGRDVEGAFSPQRFVTAYGKLSKEGRSLLFRSTGKSDLAAHLDDIAAVSSRFKELQKFANPSGTGRATMGGAMGFGAMADPMTTLASVAGARAVATILSRPATAASAARWSRTYEALAKQPTPQRLAAFNMASRNLTSTVASAGIHLNPGEFIRALQIPVSGRADVDQQQVPGEPRE